MKLLFALASSAGLLLVAQGAEAQAPAPARLLAAQSEIAFQVKQSGVPIDGKFRKFDAQLALDPKAPQTGTVALSIDTTSATVGFAESDAELPHPLWFDAAKFPQATFRSSSILGSGNGRFQVTGKLAIKGTTQDVVVPVVITQSGGVSSATGEFTVKRLEYRVGDKEWTDLSLVANDVKVKFKLVFSGLGPL
jgi:polyisoprenoid-binding protein YceI